MRHLAQKMAAFLALTVAGSASVTADLNGGASAPVSPGTYRYTYTMTLQSDVMASGDHFVFYDFYGYKPGSMTAPDLVNWTLDPSAATGPAPGTPGDNASVTNLRWAYQGGLISAASGPVILGQFSADSSVPYTGRLTFAGIRNGGLDSYYYYDAGGPTPEPSTAVLLLAGAAGIALFHRRQKLRQKP